MLQNTQQLYTDLKKASLPILPQLKCFEPLVKGVLQLQRQRPKRRTARPNGQTIKWSPKRDSEKKLNSNLLFYFAQKITRFVRRLANNSLSEQFA